MARPPNKQTWRRRWRKTRRSPASIPRRPTSPTLQSSGRDQAMLSRRSFLKSALGAGVALAGATFASAAEQSARRRTIVDAQVHLWKAGSPGWPWGPGAKPQLPEPFTIEKLVPMMDEAGVNRAVIVPPSWPGDRNDYALEAAKRYPDRFAVMGRVTLQNPQSAALLPKWKEQPGMLGVRVIFNNDVTIPWLTDGTADWLWPAAEKAGVPVMFFAPGRVSMFTRIAEHHPAAHPHHRPYGSDGCYGEGQLNPGRRGSGGRARQVPEREHQDVGVTSPFARILSVSRCDRALASCFRSLRPAALLLGDRSDELVHQGDLPPARHSFHRRAELPVGRR